MVRKKRKENNHLKFLPGCFLSGVLDKTGDPMETEVVSVVRI